MAYEQAQRQYSEPHHYPEPSSQINSEHLNGEGYRHRSPSNARQGSTMPPQQRYAPPQQVNEAVSSAASKETSNYVPPEVIAQITQSVLEKIQSGGLEGSTPIPSHSRFSPPPQQPAPLSPSTASGASQGMPNRVFTPPSPLKHSDYPDHISPTNSHSEHPAEAPHSPHEAKSSHFSPLRRSPSPQSDSSDKVHKRPKGPSRLSTSKEETTLERIWGQLFDEDSHPTARLGQFLRGLAIHIVCCPLLYRRSSENGSKLMVNVRSRTTNRSIALSLHRIRC